MSDFHLEHAIERLGYKSQQSDATKAEVRPDDLRALLASHATLKSELEILQRALSEAGDRNVALIQEREQLRGKVGEFEKLAYFIEPHWRGAGASLESGWMIKHIHAVVDQLSDEEYRAEAAEAQLATARRAPGEEIVEKIVAYLRASAVKAGSADFNGPFARTILEGYADNLERGDWKV
jgi:phage shock protein A